MRMIPNKTQPHRTAEHKNGAIFSRVRLVRFLRNIRLNIKIDNKNKQGHDQNRYQVIQPGMVHFI